MAFFSAAFDRLRAAVKKAERILKTDIRTAFVPGRPIDEAFLKELKEKLLLADAGTNLTDEIIAAIRQRWQTGRIKFADECLPIVREIKSIQN